VDTHLVRRAVEVNWRNLALGHDVFEADGATFVRNLSLPGIYDANFVFAATASNTESVERLLARAVLEYKHAARLTFRISPFTPPVLEARLALEGYERTEAIVLILEGPLRVEARPFEIRLVADDTTWQAYSDLKSLDWSEQAPTAKDQAKDLAVSRGFVLASRLKSPPVRYFLAFDDGRAVGYCNVWEGLDGMGQVEDLFVQRSHRHRGIATALIHHCTQTARALGAGPMVIVVNAANTAKTMYAAMGWRPVAICREYGKAPPA
jgi:GNAT superfamily N-acetyltransferase